MDHDTNTQAPPTDHQVQPTGEPAPPTGSGTTTPPKTTTRTTKILVAASAAVVALALGAGVAVAVADDDDAPDAAIPTAELERVERAAIEAAGGTGRVTDAELDDGTVYEIEVTHDDGTDVDVRLDRDLTVLSVDEDPPDRFDDVYDDDRFDD